MKHFFKHAFIPHAGNNFHPRALHEDMLWLYTAAILFIKIVVVFSLMLAFPDRVTFGALASSRIVELANLSRAEYNLAPLNVDPRLSASAEHKAQDMLERDYFDHNDPDGQTTWHWIKEESYVYTFAGENLGAHFTDADGIHKAWMESPTHRANILSVDYQDIGVAVVTGEFQGEETTLVVQHFGKTYVPETLVAIANPAPTALAGEGEQRPIVLAEPAQRTQVSATGVEAQIREAPSWGSHVLAGSRTFFLGAFFFLVTILALKIIINIRVQHGHIIAYTGLLILLVIAMFAVKFHWMEAVIPLNLIA